MLARAQSDVASVSLFSEDVVLSNASNSIQIIFDTFENPLHPSFSAIDAGIPTASTQIIYPGIGMLGLFSHDSIRSEQENAIENHRISHANEGCCIAL